MGGCNTHAKVDEPASWLDSALGDIRGYETVEAVKASFDRLFIDLDQKSNRLARILNEIDHW